MAIVADQGPEESRWTSMRLRVRSRRALQRPAREVVYLESRHRRFELAQTGSKKGYDTYSLSQVLPRMCVVNFHRLVWGCIQKCADSESLGGCGDRRMWALPLGVGVWGAGTAGGRDRYP